ncbi:MAG: hypothetical protein A3J79_11955 [Elusimicrobia bacterium RIFOXYB2_FULL_62_6]|nr:MAG: hypothetical protein A3J79_11955 [Elusimicrobia bacterium RIFOXYB2_FULL_62_6]
MKILLVEDNAEYATLLSDFLEQSGFHTNVVPTAKEGVKTALSFRPDLILLDYHLDDMNGYDVAMAMKYMRDTAKIPFLVLSALVTDPLLIDAFKKLPSCRGTLLKSQPFEEILARIKEALLQ